MHRFDVYRGRRVSSGRLPSILITLAALLVLGFVVVFFALPGYLTYTKEDVSLDLPFMQRWEAEWAAAEGGASPADALPGTPDDLTVSGPEGAAPEAPDAAELAEEPPADAAANPESAPAEGAAPEAGQDPADPMATPVPDGVTFDGITAELVTRNPDYSNLNMAKYDDLDIVQSVYVPYEYVNEAGLTQAVSQARALEIKALTLEVKDESGQLLWPSDTETATGYALGGTLDLEATIAPLKEQGYYLTAVISSCVDSTLVSRNYLIGLQGYNGMPYSDTYGAWMDPWNAFVRSYTVELCEELITMGFNEVVLNHCEHPTQDVVYTRQMSGELSREAAVTNFAIAVRRELEGLLDSTGAHLSVMMDTAAMNDENIDNGQNLAYLLQVFDRVYEFTETYSEANQVIALGKDSTERFVPIISWTFPGGSWAQNLFGQA